MVNPLFSIYSIIVILCGLAFSLLVVRAVLLVVGFTLSQKELSDEEKLSPFECGFAPIQEFRIPFSLHFFLITILFLVFDVELVLMFPFLTSQVPTILSSSLFVVFTIVLTAGLIIE